MTRTLLRNALMVCTLDNQNREYPGGSVLLENNRISAVGDLVDVHFDKVVDVSGCIVIPGLVNTHHHLFQVLTRCLPATQNAKLFDWLVTNYQVWRYLTPEGVRWSALAGLGELLLSGCTTSSDHLYLFPRDLPKGLTEAELEAALELGIRFHPTRGSMSLGESHGGLPPDDLCQDEDVILKDCQRVIELYHDTSPFAMTRIALAPCAPFNVSADLLRESAALARQYGVRLHTHLAETLDEETYCLEKYGVRPLDYLEKLGWLGPDVWYAHGIHFSDTELDRMAQAGTGVSHCPSSNLRLGSGFCPVPKMLQKGVPVGLAVDGSSSNDTSDMLGEVRMAMMVQRGAWGTDALTARQALKLATGGGAQILGRENEIGSLEVGKAADIAVFDLNHISYSGALHDPVAALVMTGMNHTARFVFVDGKPVVNEYKLVNIAEHTIREHTNHIAEKIVRTAEASSCSRFGFPRTPEDKHA